jgi:hypothetical protein
MGATKQQQLEEMEMEIERMNAESREAGFQDHAENEAYWAAMNEETL